MSTTTTGAATPKATFDTRDAIGLIVGLIIGAGIFRLPQLVAMNSPSELMFLAVWVIGGVLALIGALCYAELASAYPSAGGDYFFLQRAYGRTVSFLFAWARLAVITTGAIALLGFLFGDYMSNILRLGPQSSAIWAAIAVVGFTLINLVGIRESKSTQNWLTSLEVAGLVAVVIAGVLLAAPAAPAAAAAAAAEPKPWHAGFGLAMIFVLFTYSGWNEGAYISAELKDRRALLNALVVSIVLVTGLYLLVNYGYLRTLGLEGMAKSGTVAADVLKRAMGDTASQVISLIVAISALTSINATIIVGARSNYALGRDWSAFRWLGKWDDSSGTPRNAVILQGIVALALVVAGSFARDGVEAMINYTTPVFYFFFMLVGIGLFVLRTRDPRVERPFKVPLYPLTPLVFVFMCAWLLWSSVTYNGIYALFGVGVLVVGAVILALGPKK